MSEPLYLDVDGTPAFCVLHRPEGAARDTAVVFCPPFGWEEVCSYRVLREWARAPGRRRLPGAAPHAARVR